MQAGLYPRIDDAVSDAPSGSRDEIVSSVIALSNRVSQPRALRRIAYTFGLIAKQTNLTDFQSGQISDRINQLAEVKKQGKHMRQHSIWWKRAATLIAPCMVAICFVGSSVWAQEPSVNALLQNAFRLKAASLEMRLEDENSTRLDVSKKPVMTWTSEGGWSGDVFTWSADGRIQVVGCIGAHQINDDRFACFHEFHCLNEVEIKDVKLNERVVWRLPTRAKGKLIDEAPRPAAAKGLRLVQMRALARTFKVGMRVDKEQIENEMRLLPQPIAREINEEGDVVDSGLFAFVSSKGTDPEAFLLLEAQDLGSGMVWTYSAARLTTREIWLTRNGVELWRAEPVKSIPSNQIDDAYFYRNAIVLSTSDLEAMEKE